VARKKLSQDLRDTILRADTNVLVALSFAAKLFDVSETTIRNWRILEKYPAYEPVVYSLFDVFKYYSERKLKETDKLKDKLSKLLSELDWNQNLKKAQTKTADLKNAQLELKLIEYEPLKYYLLDITQKFIATLNEIPSRLSPKVFGCQNRQETYALLIDEFRIVKNALTDICLDAYKSKPVGIEMESPNGFIYDENSDSFVREKETIGE